MEHGGVGLTMRQERSQRGVAGDHGWIELSERRVEEDEGGKGSGRLQQALKPLCQWVAGRYFALDAGCV